MKQFIAGLMLGILVAGAVLRAEEPPLVVGVAQEPIILKADGSGGGCQPPNVIREFVDWTAQRNILTVIRMPVLVCPREGVCSFAPEAPPNPPPTYLCLTPEQNEEAIRRALRP